MSGDGATDARNGGAKSDGKGHHRGGVGFGGKCDGVTEPIVKIAGPIESCGRIDIAQPKGECGNGCADECEGCGNDADSQTVRVEYPKFKEEERKGCDE